MEGRGHLFVISGPAGAGKGTLRAELFKMVDGLAYSVSCTTRQPRPGEQDGRDYHFIDRDEFMRQVERGEFLEHADVHGNLYGTRRSDVEAALASGRDIVLEIDVQGEAEVKRKMPEAMTIFISPPSIEELRRRLVGRGTESPESVERRMRDAEDEMSRASEYDAVILNDDVARASRELAELVHSRRRR